MSKPYAANDAELSKHALAGVAASRAAIKQREDSIARLQEAQQRHVDTSLAQANRTTAELHRTNPMNPRVTK